MPNFELLIQQLRSDTLNNSKWFVFPVQGLNLNGCQAHVCGSITVLSRGEYLEMLEPRKKECCPFKTSVVAIVDLSGMHHSKLEKVDRHGLALLHLKGFIGALHVIAYISDSKSEKKIVISNNDEFELNEGLAPFYCARIDGLYQECFSKYDLTFDVDGRRDLTEKCWVDLFTINDKKSELQLSILKLLEISYYSSNDIHAFSRMNSWFIALNYLFRKLAGGDINRKYLAIKLSVIFEKILLSSPFDGKFVKQFDALYERMRNNILHGILPGDELSLVDEKDYRSLRHIFYTLIMASVCNEDIRSMFSAQLEDEKIKH